MANQTESVIASLARIDRNVGDNGTAASEAYELLRRRVARIEETLYGVSDEDQPKAVEERGY
jgi:hypothetical protein